MACCACSSVTPGPRRASARRHRKRGCVLKSNVKGRQASVLRESVHYRHPPPGSTFSGLRRWTTSRSTVVTGAACIPDVVADDFPESVQGAGGREVKGIQGSQLRRRQGRGGGEDRVVDPDQREAGRIGASTATGASHVPWGQGRLRGLSDRAARPGARVPRNRDVRSPAEGQQPLPALGVATRTSGSYRVCRVPVKLEPASLDQRFMAGGCAWKRPPAIGSQAPKVQRRG